MTIIDLVRLAVWLTFLLLIVGEIIGVFLARRAAKLYVKRHRELEERVAAIERRLQTIGD